MKNKIIKIFSVFTLLLLMSGCIKYNANIKISSDKKMKLELIIATSIEMQNQYGGENSTESDNEETIEKLKNAGWKVEEYEDSEYKGSRLTKTYSNIDDLSSTDPNVEFDFNALVQEGEEGNYMFYKKEENDKTTYYAKFKASASQTNNSSLEEDEEELTEEEKQSQEEMNKMVKEMMKSADLKITVEVPKVINNNATKVEGNKLIWDLNEMEDNQGIEFEFELTGNSFPIVPVAIIGGTVLLVVIVVVIVLSSKKKKNNIKGFTPNNQPNAS